jgi:exodeoxyribonuclease VII large subunit
LINTIATRLQPFIKLSELTRHIEKVLKEHFSEKTYWVVGEIIGYRNYPLRNQCYFELTEKDESSANKITSIRAGIWGKHYDAVKYFESATGQVLKDNIQVLLLVKVDYSMTHGLKLDVLDINKEFTIGQLEKSRKETLMRLVQLNPAFIQLVNNEYITRNKRVGFNSVIQNVAVIASSNSDGWRDFITELTQNKFGFTFNVDLYDTQLQGSSASAAIKQQLVSIYKTHEGGRAYDAVVIVRGGGSQTDFTVFDDYELARAVAKMPIPVITGIGHEMNESVVDLMAKLKTKTPTKAAESIIAHNRSFEEQLMLNQKMMLLKVNQLLASHELRLSIINSSIISRTQQFLSNQKEQMMPLLGKIARNAGALIEGQKFRLDKYIYKLNAGSLNTVNLHQYFLNAFVLKTKLLSPENVLKRGYSLIFINGRIVKDPKEIIEGNTIMAMLYNTEITSIVTGKKQKDQ